jgi:hypothetical protein
MSTTDQIALWGSVAATVLGIASIIIALRANSLSAAAANLARTAYLSERRVGITSAVERDANGVTSLVLSPAASDQTVNSVTLYFPSKFGVAPIPLSDGNLRLSALAMSGALTSYLDSRTPPRAGIGQVRRNAPIPVAALVHGQSKGDATVTLGIYDLYCQYVRVEDRPGHLEVLSLTLNNWSASGADPQAEANRVLAAYEAFSSASD